jgi:hypothetical protein
MQGIYAHPLLYSKNQTEAVKAKKFFFFFLNFSRKPASSRKRSSQLSGPGKVVVAQIFCGPSPLTGTRWCQSTRVSAWGQKKSAASMSVKYWGLWSPSGASEFESMKPTAVVNFSKTCHTNIFSMVYLTK